MSKTARLMKDSGIEWIGEIPRGWEVSRLKYIVSYNDETLSESTEENFEFDYIDIGSVEYGKGITELQHMIFKDAPSRARRIVREDDIILSTVRTYLKAVATIGKFSIPQIVSTGFIVLRARQDRILSQFLKFAILSNTFISSVEAHSVGISYPAINSSCVVNLKIPLPPLPEQQKIADYLDEKCGKIDLVIAKSEEIIEKLKAYKLSLITETVTKGLDPNAPMKDSGIEWIGEIPCHWHILRIKWLLNERNERSLSGKEEPLSMSQKYGLVPTRCMDTIPNMASTFVGAKLCHKNDLVFNKLKAHLGVFAVSHYDGLVSPDYAVYYSNTKVNLKYLEFLFKTPQYIGEFKKKSTGVGAGLTRLYTSDLYSIYCAFPPLPEQQKSAAYLDAKCAAIDKNIADRQTLIEKLTAYKKSLIYEAVTGKKEI